MDYKIVLDNATKKLVQVLGVSTDTPAGYTQIGTFTHPGAEQELVIDRSHVIYQHVQTALYKQGILGLQSINISWPGKVLGTALAADPTSVNVTTRTSVQLAPVFTPTAVSDKRVRYVSENDRVARVSATGKVFGQSVGTTRIRVFTVDGRLSVNVPVTVTADAGSADLEGE